MLYILFVFCFIKVVGGYVTFPVSNTTVSVSPVTLSVLTRYIDCCRVVNRVIVNVKTIIIIHAQGNNTVEESIRNLVTKMVEVCYKKPAYSQSNYLVKKSTVNSTEKTPSIRRKTFVS